MNGQSTSRRCSALLNVISIVLLGSVPLAGIGQVHMAPDNIRIVGSDLGGDALQLFGGNLLLKGAAEPAIRMQHDGVLGDQMNAPSNPLFHMGRIELGGDGSPNFRFLYQDDILAERLVFQFDGKGIVASTKPDRGSHFEGFLNDHCEPLFRLNSNPDMRLEFGEGAFSPVDLVMTRDAPGSLSIISTSDAGTLDSECNPQEQNSGVPLAERLRITAEKVSPTKDITVVKVINGYLQLDLSSGSPPSDDCSNEGHYGRMQVDPTTQELWICVQGAGTSGIWVSK